MMGAMPRTVVKLPPHIRPPFDVFISGVPQRAGIDYLLENDRLVFPERELVKDKVSGWRWFLGAWGVGTYRQDDSIDIRYEVAGRPQVAEGLEPVLED
jgi:hypothetical protein